MYSFKCLIFGFICSLLYISCSPEEGIPDVSDIAVTVRVLRFDQDLKQLDTINIDQSIKVLREQYGEFYDRYFQNILPIRGETPTDFTRNLKGFLGNESIVKLNDTIDIVFGDFVNEKRRFEQAFKYYRYYFPEAAVPDIYTIMSEFSLQKFIDRVDDRDVIGLGLDMFLGSEYPYNALDPKNPAFSKYLTRRFDKAYMVKKAMEMLIEDRMGAPKGDRLLDIMIHNGKKLFILDKVLPFEPDSIIMEYTANQMDWVEDNELEIWAFFFKEELFYKTNRMEINKYINVSPQSPGMPIEAPGRTANYIGWQIVKAYMKRQPDLSFTELINEPNSQKILDKSRYKPTR